MNILIIKTLNEEQITTLNTKPSIEKALADIESMKSQLEEVAAKEDASKEVPESLSRIITL